MEIGVDSFVAATIDAAGRALDPARHLSELLEAITLADEVGLDVFGIGEHHRHEFLDSAPTVILAANRMFHPAGATSFPCARVVLLLAGKIRFFAAPAHSAGAVLQRTCGPRCRYSIQTTSLSSPVRH